MLGVEAVPMAWPRGKAKDDKTSPPASPPQFNGSEMLPDVKDKGTTQDRDASKRIRKADSDLKKLERKGAKVLKREEKELRKLDRAIARYQRSRNLAPYQLVVTVAICNGVAAAMMMLKLWWPELLPLDAVLPQENAHFTIILICFLVSTVVSFFLLSRNPSPEYLFRAQYSLGMYFAYGLMGAFSGMLLAYVMVDIETLHIDWVFWQWIFVYLIAGSAISMVVIRLIAHRTGSRSFLSGTYHKVMGSLSVILAISLVLLPIFYLPHRGWMYDAGISVMYVGWFIMLFPVPAITAAIQVKLQAAALRKALSAY
jgi:hypothetical protein